jgi:hypothetical protein
MHRRAAITLHATRSDRHPEIDKGGGDHHIELLLRNEAYIAQLDLVFTKPVVWLFVTFKDLMTS